MVAQFLKGRSVSTDRPLQWRHNERDMFTHDCLLNGLFRRGSKKTPTLRVTGLYEGNSPVTGKFPLKEPVMRKMFPFDDVIMSYKKGSMKIIWWK